MAGIIAKDVIDRIRMSLDIADVIGSYIQVKRTGATAKALCPFHKEKTPSFSINSARQAFHCFGCQAGGDVFKFVMLYENVDFPTAIRMLADRAGIALQFDEGGGGGAKSGDGPAKDEIWAVNEEAAKRYHKKLLQGTDAEAARNYLTGRQLSSDVWTDWMIGYAPDGWGFLTDGPTRRGWNNKTLEAAGLLSKNEKGNVYDRFRDRVMFTIRDELGRVVGFSGRTMKDGQDKAGKYVNTPETPVFRKSRILFGLDKAKREILDQRKVILCEGQVDCIRCHLAGFINTVASQGTAFTEEHALLLKRYADHVVVVLDADAAGEKAALRTAELLLGEGLAVSLASLPAKEDPDSLILKGGPDAFAAVLDNSRPPMDFLIELLRRRMDFSTQEGLLKASRAVLELAGHAQNATQAEGMLRTASVALNISLTSLQGDLRRLMRRQRRGMAPAASTDAPPSVPQQPMPPEEIELAMLLGTCGTPEVTAFIREWLPYSLLTHADCRLVIQTLAEEEDLMTAAGDGSDACQQLAARIANAPKKVSGVVEVEGSALKAAQDLVIGIWRQHLERLRLKLANQLKTADPAGRDALRHEFNAVVLDKQKLKRDWKTAQPIIELYLSRLAS